MLWVNDHFPWYDYFYIHSPPFLLFTITFLEVTLCIEKVYDRIWCPTVLYDCLCFILMLISSILEPTIWRIPSPHPFTGLDFRAHLLDLWVGSIIVLTTWNTTGSRKWIGKKTILSTANQKTPLSHINENIYIYKEKEKRKQKKIPPKLIAKYDGRPEASELIIILIPGQICRDISNIGV